MDKKIKILFVGHTASLSGAPLVLLNFAKWLKCNKPDIIIDIWIIEKGTYFTEYQTIFNKVFYSEVPLTVIDKVKRKIESRFNISDQTKFVKQFKGTNYDIIYCNTVVTLDWGVKLKIAIKNIKLIVHIHELNGAIRMLEPNFKGLSLYVDLFIGVSYSVIQNLSDSYQINLNKVKLVYEFIDLEKSKSVKEKYLTSFFKIGTSGFADWRKGYDLFLLTAYQFKKKFPHLDIKFQWVGGVPLIDEIIIDEDIKKLGLENIVVFSGETTSPLDEFNQFEIFLLLSREDPFPLVCLEAGSLGKPIICFEKAGGITELIANGGGIIVPYLDINEVVDAIFIYYSNSTKLTNDGNMLKDRICDYDVNRLAPKLFEFLANTINSN